MNFRPLHLLLVVACLVTFLSLAPCAFLVLAEEPEAPVGEVATEGVDLERQFVMLGELVLFVPEVLLAEKELEDLPLRHSRMSLEIRMERWRNPPDPPLNAAGVVPRCWPPYGYVRGGRQPYEDLGRALQGSDLLVLGTIRTVVIGWDVRSARVVRMAYLDVEEVISSDGLQATTPRVGSTLVFSTTGGELMLEDVPICTLKDPNEYDPVAGDRVLVSSLPPKESGFLEASLVFRVGGDLVLGGKKANNDLPLNHLRELLAQSEPEEN